MNCIEVGDLMQRKLDFDLSEQETKQLETHLATCASCKMMFERLSLLSTQLEQLPHVTPSISIVDSILPKLAEIDKLNEEANHIIKREEAAHSEQLHVNNIQSKLRKKWIMITTSGLVAAAALILTVNLSNNNDNIHTNTVADNSSFSSAEIFENSQRTDAELKESLDIMARDQFGNAVDSDQVMEIAPTSKQVDQFHVATSNPPEESNESLPFPSLTDPTEQHFVHRDVGTDFTQNTSSEPLPSKVEGEEQPKSDFLGEAEEEFGVMTINEPEEVSFTSPNQKFYLQIDEHIITVRDLNDDKTIKIFEIPIEGEVRLIGWHELSTEFYIEVIDHNFQAHNLTFGIGL